MKGGHLTLSQKKIKGIQIKLHLHLSSLNFLIPSNFIGSGLIKNLKNHIQIFYCYFLGEKCKFKLYIVTTLNLIYYLHEVYIIICIINYFFFIMFSYFSSSLVLRYIPCLHLVFWLYLLLLLCNCVVRNFLATANLKINHISIFLKCQVSSFMVRCRKCDK